MSDDAELLLRYARENSEPAFAELVRRHLGLVYHAALRQVGGDAHLAQDVAQSVFTDLARKATALARRPVLAGWLYTSTHYAATQVVRSERRRRAREQAAHTMTEILSDPAPVADWERKRPVIDDVLRALNERDREAILLRFFEGRAFAEVGARISASEDAARVRVDRALEKMRIELARRGVTSTTAALGLVLAGQSAAAAPAGLAATVTGAVLASVAGGGLVSAMAFMSMNKLAMGMAATLAAAGAAGLVAQGRTNAELRAELQQLQGENQQIASLQAGNAQLARRSAEVEAMRADDAELLQLSDEAAGLQARMQAAARRAEVSAGKAVYDVHALDRPPHLRSPNRLVYPAEMKQAGMGGSVVVDFVVDNTGKVHNSYVIQSSRREFEDPAIQAVNQWEFDPGRRGGRSVNTHMQVPIVFTPDKGEAAAGEPTPASDGKKP